ncbi:MAG: hypothetical protein U1E15_03130 [Hyphomicrobiales bacterium]
MKKYVAAAFALLAFSAPAMAYVGPGAGISLIGAVLGFFGVIGTTLGFVVMAPFRAARKRAAAARKTAQ